MIDSDWLGGLERCKKMVARRKLNKQSYCPRLRLRQKSLHLGICNRLPGLLVIIPYFKHETSSSCIYCNVYIYIYNTPHTGCRQLGYLFLRGWCSVLFIPNTLLLFAGLLGDREEEREYERERTKLPTVLISHLITAT